MNAIEKATGAEPQYLFAPEHIWVWYFAAAAWFGVAIKTAVDGFRT
jgi:hypothetical protein